MKQYLLSIYQPDGDPPPPAVLEQVMRDINALRRELKAAARGFSLEACTLRARPPWCGSGTTTCS